MIHTIVAFSLMIICFAVTQWQLVKALEKVEYERSKKLWYKLMYQELLEYCKRKEKNGEETTQPRT